MGGSLGTWRLGRRPALDGLRGVAILLVLAAHAGPPALGSMGNVGVAVFFTLSGFLITGMLIEERARGRVDLRGFYMRRVRRLAPALVAFLIVACTLRAVLGPWWLDWRALPLAAAYLANWAPSFGVNLGPVMVLWTLAVEEQFYLLWPLVVIAAARRSRVVVVATVLAAVSLLDRLLLLGSGAGWDRVMGGSDTVAFALLVGAVCVGCRLGGEPGRVRPMLAWVAVAAAAAVPFLVSSGGYRLVGFPAVGVLTACALWALTGDGEQLGGWGVGWLRWFGSRSYGIYLWHWPIVWWMTWHLELAWPVVAAVGVPVSLLIAEASYRWVECPFRARRNASRPASGSEQGADIVVVHG
jgi:peptidoglycan/LPS O-acetylase OafA/YrhL